MDERLEGLTNFNELYLPAGKKRISAFLNLLLSLPSDFLCGEVTVWQVMGHSKFFFVLVCFGS